jgi:hypothetical protein
VVGWEAMGWDGLERGEFLSGGLEERKRSFSSGTGQDKSMIYQRTSMDSIKADAYGVQYSTVVVD